MTTAGAANRRSEMMTIKDLWLFFCLKMALVVAIWLIQRARAVVRMGREGKAEEVEYGGYCNWTAPLE